jgi:hypothetical protein
MALYELLEARLVENQHKEVWLYDLLEARIKERQQSDELFRLLAERLQQKNQE